MKKKYLTPQTTIYSYRTNYNLLDDSLPISDNDRTDILDIEEGVTHDGGMSWRWMKSF